MINAKISQNHANVHCVRNNYIKKNYNDENERINAKLAL